MVSMVKTHVAIIGAGPVGLFAVFELGLLDIETHVIDVLPKVGGQCAELYPDKPIYDIPAIPKISGQELTDQLMEQIKPFKPEFHLGHVVEELQELDDGFLIKTDQGLSLEAKLVVIAAGGGRFTPKKPPIQGIEDFEGSSVFYALKDRSVVKDKSVVIAGGGDSALDWALELYPETKDLTVVHRREEFRAAPHSVQNLKALEAEGKIKIIIGDIIDIKGEDGQLSSVSVRPKHDRDQLIDIDCHLLMPFYGLTMTLGPIAQWGLNLERDLIPVDTEKFETSAQGIFAIGDINHYPGKLKLILSGFHESALMAQAAFKYIFPDKKLRFQYTTASSSLQKKLGVRE